MLVGTQSESENLYIAFAVHISLISIFHVIKILFVFYKDIRFHKFSQLFTLSNST